MTPLTLMTPFFCKNSENRLTSSINSDPNDYFAWVQLPNYEGGLGWMLVREAMLKTLSVPRTGMAVAIDIGESKNIHPKNKQEVARRLSLWALSEIYGQ